MTQKNENFFLLIIELLNNLAQKVFQVLRIHDYIVIMAIQ